MNIIIVDENDNPIGVKERKLVDQNNDIYRVSCLWLFNERGETLLAQRAYTKEHDPGTWGPAAAGTVEEGETYESNIVKEIEEELGVTDIVPIRGDKTFRSGRRQPLTQRFFAICSKEIADFRIDPTEVHAIRWWSRDALERGLTDRPAAFLPSFQKEGSLHSVWDWFERSRDEQL